MPEQALYLKWRPRTFDDVIGQGHITRTLRNALIQNRIRHAYLFNGPRGTGKTTMARILAKAVNCLHPDPALRPCDACPMCEAINESRFLDLIEIDAASHNGVDDVRDLREKIQFAPSEGRYKVYIVDEVHRFSPQAFDALLKTLEEPPEHAIFVLATTELDKVPPTIRSRSLLFEFRRVSVNDVAERLQRIAESEGVQIEDAALQLVAMQGTGSVRDSISLLDQLIANPEETITLEFAERALGTAGQRTVRKLVQAIIDADAATGLDLLSSAIDAGADPGQFGRQIVAYLRDLMLVQIGGPVETTQEQYEIYKQQSDAISRGALLRAVRAFNAALSEVKTGWQPQLPIELALVESTRPPSEPQYERPERAERQSIPPRTEPEPPIFAQEAGDEPPPISLSSVRQAWPDIIQRLRETPKYQPLSMLLAKARVIAADARTITLAADDETTKGLLERDMRIINIIFERVFKVNLYARIVVSDAATTPEVDDTIMDDPLIGNELKSGGKIAHIEDTQGGID